MNILYILKKIFTIKSKEIKSLEKRINYTFYKKYYIEKALTHRSIQHHSLGNYERLEFVGDAVIDQTVSIWLFKTYPHFDEGILTKKRSSLVNRDFLSIMGQNLKLVELVKVDQSVNLNDPKVSAKINADVYEAIVGAIYLDGGYKYASKFIKNTICKSEHINSLDQNYKGQLIEYCHCNGLNPPQFSIINSIGPEHNKIFIVNVSLDNNKIFEGKGSTKKSAEQNCARNAINSIL